MITQKTLTIIVVLICLVFLAVGAFSETTDNAPINYYLKDQVKRVFVVDSNLRQAPSHNSPLITTLPIGESVTVLEDAYPNATDTPQEVINGISAPWVKIQIGTIKGYIWGGLLARNSLETDLGRDGTSEIIMVGPTLQELDKPLQSEIRVLFGKKILNRYPIKTNYPDINSLQTTLYHPQGFTPQIDILKIDFAPEACGVTGGELLFAWDGKTWFPILEESYGSDAGAYSNYFELYFPKEAGGIENTIRLKRTNSYDWDEATGGYKIKDVSWTDYQLQQDHFKKTAAK